MLQLAKSAICAGVLTLLDSAGLPPQEIPQFYVAGGFGHYLNKESAGSIGLFPNALFNAMQTVGNAALSGAAMLLLDANAKTVAQGLCKNANVLDLSTSPVFSEHYMMGMLLGKQL